MATRKPADPKPSASKALKSIWKKSGKHSSLKSFVSTSTMPAVMEVRDNWTFNKKANFSNPPKGIGRTRRKKTKNQKVEVKKAE
jgi:hypothetical protein